MLTAGKKKGTDKMRRAFFFQPQPPLMREIKGTGTLKMLNHDRISGGFWLVVALIFCFESYRLGLGTFRQPGPGFIFFGTAIILALLSVKILIKAWRSQETTNTSEKIREYSNYRKVIFVLAAIFIYAMLVEKLGFIPMTLLLLLYVLGFIEKRGLWFSIAVSLMITIAAFVVFQIWLKSQLPPGVLAHFRL